MKRTQGNGIKKQAELNGAYLSNVGIVLP